jgi:hypothetical protein
MIVVTHAPTFVAALGQCGDRESFALEKQFGETIVRDRDPVRWVEPTR